MGSSTPLVDLAWPLSTLRHSTDHHAGNTSGAYPVSPQPTGLADLTTLYFGSDTPFFGHFRVCDPLGGVRARAGALSLAVGTLSVHCPCSSLTVRSESGEIIEICSRKSFTLIAHRTEYAVRAGSCEWRSQKTVDHDK